jgi:hypothetical protein
MAVIVNLDRPRELRLGYKALETLEEITGKTIIELEEELFARPSLKMIKNILYCGLLKDAEKHGETLTPEMVTDMLDEVEDLSEVMRKVSEAYLQSFPPQDEAEKSGNAQAGKSKKLTTSKKA